MNKIRTNGKNFFKIPSITFPKEFVLFQSQRINGKRYGQSKQNGEARVVCRSRIAVYGCPDVQSIPKDVGTQTREQVSLSGVDFPSGVFVSVENVYSAEDVTQRKSQKRSQRVRPFAHEKEKVHTGQSEQADSYEGEPIAVD